MDEEKNDGQLGDVNSQESSTQTNENGTTQSDEGSTQPVEKKLPFHEDPQVQEYINRQLETREQRLKDELEQKFATPKDQKVVIPNWFGGDEQAWSQYQAHLEERDTRVRESALKEIQGLTQKEQNLIKEANEWFESNVKEIEKTDGPVDKNLLFKTAQDFELVDSKGRWNWKAAHRIAKSQYKSDPTKVDERKKIVGMDRNDQGGTGQKDFKTAKDFQKARPW